MMSDANDDDNTIGYGGAAEAYFNAGWRGILPLRHGTKWPPPPWKKAEPGEQRTHYTGYEGVDPSWADITAWSEEVPDGNLCLRLPDGIIGIDVDAYGDKSGAGCLVEAVKRWGPLPPTSRSTSRDNDYVSGIRLFRVPPGTQLETKIKFDLGPQLEVGNIEIIQRHHRYVAAWPSVHPEGRIYWWRNDALQLVGIPNPTELPWLPQRWIAGLKVQPRTGDLGDASYDVTATLTPGDPSVAVAERLGKAIRELNSPSGERHDTGLKHVMALMRLGKDGEPGVKHALLQLCDVFVAITTADGSRTPDIARGEFVRMITNDNAARELSKPGLVDWVNALIMDDLPAAPDQPGALPSPAPPDSENTCPGCDEPPCDLHGSAPSGGVEGADTANVDTSGRSVTVENTPEEAVRRTSQLEIIEQGFWQSRESLQQIYTTALAMMASPWAVLGVCASKAITQVRPHVVLPPVIGGPGSLNSFAAIVARSGGGKGAASAASRILIPDQNLQMRNLGSGEGIVAAFGRPQDDDDPTPTHEAIMFNVDEVDTLAALHQRSASTTLSTLRSAFMGETIGFSYADKSKRRHIQAHTYRMTMVVSVQPKRAGGLLADEGGGTPQRFMWFPAKDSRITMDERWPTGPLTLPDSGEWQYPREIVIPDQTRYELRLNRVKDSRDELDALDGHALFCREKFAYALTVLDGRIEMTIEDWELSGIASAVSSFVRERAIDEVRDAARIDALDRGEIRGIENVAAEEMKALEEAERVRRLLRWVLDKVTAAEDGLTVREITQKCSGRDRKWLGPALQVAQSNGLVRLTEDGRWVKI